MFDYSRLSGKIKEIFGTQDNFASALGISATSLSKKLNGVTDFTQKEMVRSCELLGISNVEEYFFCKKVKET
ncbi:MAG: DUF739 family protein [Clostridia bacterium]|nr:DUF739 family protein [Clostridia bacterium]